VSTQAQQFTFVDQIDYDGRDSSRSDSSTSINRIRDMTPVANDAYAFETFAGPVGNVINFDGSFRIFPLAPPSNQDEFVQIIVDPITGLGSIIFILPNGPFTFAFDKMGIEQSSSWRSSDIGAVLWWDGRAASSEDRAASETISVLQGRRRHSRGHAGSSDRSSQPRPTAARFAFAPEFTRFALNRQVGGVGVLYGYREIGIWNHYAIEADGGIYGGINSYTESDNHVIGPQGGVVAFRRFGPLSFYAHGLFLAGLNNGSIQQNNRIGEDLERTPGVVNRPFRIEPVESEYTDTRDEFVPMGEFWVESGLQITDNTSIKVAWSALIVNNILLSQDRIRFLLPDMGFRDPGNQHMLVQNFFCGFEVVR
jgi:hypothetical protein